MESYKEATVLEEYRFTIFLYVSPDADVSIAPNRASARVMCITICTCLTQLVLKIDLTIILSNKFD